MKISKQQLTAISVLVFRKSFYSLYGQSRVFYLSFFIELYLSYRIKGGLSCSLLSGYERLPEYS